MAEDGGVSVEEARVMDVQQGGRCFYCDQPIGRAATFDHVVPRAYGGVDGAANIVLAHRRCNQAKGDRLPTPEEIARLIELRRGSRLGLWPPILALAQAEPGQEWITLARAVAAC